MLPRSDSSMISLVITSRSSVNYSTGRKSPGICIVFVLRILATWNQSCIYDLSYEDSMLLAIWKGFIEE
jgi:hypothetical protein